MIPVITEKQFWCTQRQGRPQGSRLILRREGLPEIDQARVCTRLWLGFEWNSRRPDQVVRYSWLTQISVGAFHFSEIGFPDVSQEFGFREKLLISAFQ